MLEIPCDDNIHAIHCCDRDMQSIFRAFVRNDF